MTKRLSNFELIRIIAMIFIIASHYLSDGMYTAIDGANFIYKFSSFSGYIFGKIGVHLFLLITGYFMIDKTFKIRRFLKVFIDTVFYSYLLLILFAIFSPETLNFDLIYKCLLPVSTSQSIFVTCYLMLYLLIPLLNHLFFALSKEKLDFYLILLIIIQFGITTFGYKINPAGSHLLWYIIIYFVGAYNRIYGIKFLNKFSNSIIVIFVTFIPVIIYTLICIYFNINDKMWFIHFSTTNSICTLLISVSLFSILKNFKINNFIIINYFAKSAFAVYLITDNLLLRNIIWTDYFKCTHYNEFMPILLNLSFSVISSYLICTLIDNIKTVLFDKYILSKIFSIKYLDKIDKYFAV